MPTYTMPDALQRALKTLNQSEADAVWDWINDETAIEAATQIQEFIESEIL